VDNLEDIDYLSKPNTTTVQVCNVLRRAVTKEFLPIGLATLHRELIVFNLWTAQIPLNITPKINDVIIDAAERQYTVIAIELLTWETRYKCYCQEVLA
jgi:hypothetical protein